MLGVGGRRLGLGWTWEGLAQTKPTEKLTKINYPAALIFVQIFMKGSPEQNSYVLIHDSSLNLVKVRNLTYDLFKLASWL